ncbi:hypothetical protein T484DRAFT_1948196 [Baffinella frigidus]|nr:hypothetical protein T484DRAFT_1948196 [Cryptophyta sp. CCMP2293]
MVAASAVVILLSPAKTMDMSPAEKCLETKPRMLEQAGELLLECQKLGKPGIKKMQSTSDAITGLNFDRFSNFDTQEEKQAALAFDGPAYRGLDAASMTEEERAFAQDHLRILCGLYGVLRPFDLIRPYRLEMSNALPNAKGPNLYSYWGGDISASLEQDLDAQGDGPRMIVNCASQEYFKSVQQNALRPETQVVTCEFPGASVYAKRARGLMSAFVIRNQVRTLEGLKEFRGTPADPYSFSPAQSTDTRLMFLRGKAGPAEAKKPTAPKKPTAAKPAKAAATPSNVSKAPKVSVAKVAVIKMEPKASKAKAAASLQPTTTAVKKEPVRKRKAEEGGEVGVGEQGKAGGREEGRAARAARRA